jgi:hypothetical protein
MQLPIDHSALRQCEREKACAHAQSHLRQCQICLGVERHQALDEHWLAEAHHSRMSEDTERHDDLTGRLN